MWDSRRAEQNPYSFLLDAFPVQPGLRLPGNLPGMPLALISLQPDGWLLSSGGHPHCSGLASNFALGGLPPCARPMVPLSNACPRACHCLRLERPVSSTSPSKGHWCPMIHVPRQLRSMGCLWIMNPASLLLTRNLKPCKWVSGKRSGPPLRDLNEEMCLEKNAVEKQALGDPNSSSDLEPGGWRMVTVPRI